jgi:hypothetical protein
LRWVGQRNTTLLALLTAACMPVQGGLSEVKTGFGPKSRRLPGTYQGLLTKAY